MPNPQAHDMLLRPHGEGWEVHDPPPNSDHYRWCWRIVPMK